MTISHQPNRTRAYAFTTDTRDCPYVKAVRDGIKMRNAQRNEGEPRLYVKLQARGHRRGVRRYNQSLPLEFGTHFDVYIYQRNDW